MEFYNLYIYLEILIGLMAIFVVVFRILVIGFPMLIHGYHTNNFALIFKSFTQFV